MKFGIYRPKAWPKETLLFTQTHSEINHWGGNGFKVKGWNFFKYPKTACAESN